MPRQSEQPPPVPEPNGQPPGDIERTRQEFSRRLNEQMERLGVEPKDRTTWIRDRLGTRPPRWQTVQHWLNAKSFPQGARLSKLAQVVGVNVNDLVGAIEDDDPPESFAAFRAGEGASMTHSEVWTLRMFPWPAEPTVSDYRSLLATLRGNAERA